MATPVPLQAATCTAVLEAAHVHPCKGDHTNVVSNGLLLRARHMTAVRCSHMRSYFKIARIEEILAFGYLSSGTARDAADAPKSISKTGAPHD